jgi:hypothetical protein
MLFTLLKSLPAHSKQSDAMLRRMRSLRWSIALLAMMALAEAHAEKSVTLAWDPSPTPTVVGYTVQYGTNSGQYSEFLLLGIETTATVPELREGVTYYFVVTAHTEEGLESDPSNELVYTVPDGTIPYLPPTLSLIPDMIIDEDSGHQTVTLSGLSAGITSSNITITATASNPGLVPYIAISYPTGGSEGFLTFAPAPNGFGSAIITVTVNNLQPVNNLVTRTFTVTAYSVNDKPTLSPLSNLTLEADAGPQPINLSGIGAGAPNEDQLLSVSADSSNPGMIPAPEVSYASPGSTGILTLVPAAWAEGTTTITVTVSDGQHVISRNFEVTVNPPAIVATYYLEAEAGTVRSPMIIAASTNAFSGSYVYSQSREQGDVTYNLNVAQAGNYIIWCRVLSRTIATDSFFISLNGGAETVYHTSESKWSTSWQWTRVNNGLLPDALIVPLIKGTNTFRFRSREPSTLLDSIYITNNRDFVPVQLTVARKPNQPQAIEVRFQPAAGYRYAIDYTEDFRSWSTVWSVATNIPQVQTISYADDTSSAANRFYRVRVNP